MQINMDDYVGDETEEKNPYPANDYITKGKDTPDQPMTTSLKVNTH